VRAFGHADEIERLAHRALLLGARAHLMNAQRHADDVGHGAARVQRRIRVLEDGLDLARVGAALARVDFLAVQQHVARARREQAQQHLGQRALTATGLADQAQCLALGDAQRHVVDGLDLAGRAEQPTLQREVAAQCTQLERKGHVSCSTEMLL